MMNVHVLTCALTFALGLFPVVLGEPGQLGTLDCESGVRPFDPLRHKKTYFVGIHAPGGEYVARQEYNLTFEEYLTATAGQRFSPPIEFKMTTSSRPIHDWVDQKQEIDFFYSDVGEFLFPYVLPQN
jgi:hypothetical protein